MRCRLLVTARLCFNALMSAEFHPAVARWFARTFAAPTPAQRAAWPVIAAQRHVLIAAPTGSGKTLAAFLAAIEDRKSTRLNSSHRTISYAVFCLKKKKNKQTRPHRPIN